MVHHLDVRLEGLPRPEGPESSAFDRDRSRLEARLTGSLGVHPADVQRVVAAPTGRAAPSPPQRLEGWIRVEGRAGRLPTFAFSKGGSPRLLVSGPFQAWAAIGGTPRAPVISLSVSLDRTRLEIGRWLRKPAGVLARLQIEPEARDAPFPARVVIELGDVAARGKLGAGGRLRLATEWVPVTTLRRWVPEIEARAHRGAVRLALETAEPGSTWRVDLNGVEIDPAPIAIPHVELSGQGRLVGGTLLEVRGLQAKLGTSRFVLDLRAQRHAGSGGMRLRFHARTDRMDLSGLEPEEEEPLALEPGEDALALPSALRAAVERPLVLLQRTRARLANVELQSGRLEARRVNCGSETLQDLVVDLALENRRLEVHRFSFRDAEGLRDYGGQIDLNPLVPRVDLVARSTSTLPAAMPLP